MSTTANQLAARAFTSAYVATLESGIGTGYGSITTFGPWVSVVTGTQALVGISCQLWNSVAATPTFMGYGISNASTINTSDDRAIICASVNPGIEAGIVVFQTGLTPGTNQFTCQYRVNGNTGTWVYRRIWVMPL